VCSSLDPDGLAHAVTRLRRAEVRAFGREPRILHFHQRWLEGLVRAANLGHPDSTQEIPQ
jgi:hypothetical protein